VLLYVAYILYCWGSRINSEAEEAPSEQQQYNAAHDAPWSVDEFADQPKAFNGGVGDTVEVSLGLWHKHPHVLFGIQMRPCCGFETWLQQGVL
jgi:hypothetical protein